MKFTPAGKNRLLDSLTGIVVSIHTANPTDAGTAAEVTGGTYSRQSVGFEAAVNGNRNANALPTFDIPGGTTVSHAALWINTTCIAQGPLSAIEAYTNDGTYTLTDADLTLLDS